MRYLSLLFLVFPFTFFGQNYYDTNNSVEKLLSDLKFEDGLELVETSLKSKTFESDDEKKYYQFLKNMCDAQINVWRKNDLNTALTSCAEGYKLLIAVKNVSPVRKSNFIQYYATLIAYTGNNQKQISLLEECFEILNTREKTKEVELEIADNHDKIGTAFYNMYDDKKTDYHFSEALKIYTKHNYDDAQKMGKLHHSVSLLNRDFGYFDKAEFHNDKAILFMEKNPKVNVYEILYRAYEIKIGNEIEYGRTQTANAYLNKMKDLKDKIKSINPKEEQFDIQSIETRYLAAFVNYNIEIKNKKNIVNALDELKKIYNFNKIDSYKKDNVYTMTAAYANAAIFFREAKDYENAIKVNTEMLKHLQKSNLPQSNTIFNGNLAYVYNDLKQYDKALKHIDEAIRDSKKINYPKLNAYISLRNEILINKQLVENTNDTISQTAFGNTKRLLEKMLNKSLTENQVKKINYNNFKNLNSERDLLAILTSAEIHLKLFIAKKDKSDLQLSNKLYHVASDMFGQYYKKGLFNDKLSNIVEKINEGLLSTTQELKNNTFAEVLEKVENNYSKYLWNEFIIKNLDVNSTNSKNQIAQLRQINTEKNNLITELESKSNQQKETDSLSQEIEKLEKKEKQLSDKIQRSNPIFNTYSNPNLDLKSLQKNIADSQKILRYIVTANKVFLFEIDKNTIQLYSLGNIKNIENKCKLLVTNLYKSTSNYSNAAIDLSKMILPKNIKLSKNTIIIADSFLNYLPFETLKGKSSDFLLQETNISYAASLLLWRDQNSAIVSSNNFKLIAFAPKYDKTISKESDIAYLQRNNLFELKGAKEEALQISKKFNGQLVSESEATKSSFLENAKNFQLIHLAMHSVLDEENPQNSNLIFANNEKLFFSELYGISLPAKMAVISACNTGNGKLMNGEGIMSLSRAFTFAGVKCTVISLWQVPDKETSEIMISFYENLKKGQPKDEALTNAKKEFLATNPMKQHPFYWAGFVVNGDVSPITNPTSNWVWFTLAGGILIVILGFVFRKKLF